MQLVGSNSSFKILIGGIHAPLTRRLSSKTLGCALNILPAPDQHTNLSIEIADVLIRRSEVLRCCHCYSVRVTRSSNMPWNARKDEGNLMKRLCNIYRQRMDVYNLGYNLCTRNIVFTEKIQINAFKFIFLDRE